MSKALVLAENDFEDVELFYPYYRLLEAGLEVEVVGDKAGEVYHGKKGGSIKSTLGANQITIDDYIVLIIPGGYGPDRMRTKPELVKLVKDANEKRLIIGAICHAAQLLIEADIVKDRTLTCYKSVSTDVKNAGGKYVDESVVTDENLVTSRFPADMPFWMPAILEKIQ